MKGVKNCEKGVMCEESQNDTKISTSQDKCFPASINTGYNNYCYSCHAAWYSRVIMVTVLVALQWYYTHGTIL